MTTMTHWNYRIVHSLRPDGTESGEMDDVYEVHEVYYDRETILAWGETQAPFGESVDGLRRDLTYMLEALDKPVLERADLPGSHESQGGEA